MNSIGVAVAIPAMR